MSEHEELESSVAAWILGALDGDDADAIRLHIEGCASCHEVASRMRRTAGAIPLEVEEVAPPARLRERILVAATASREPSTAPVVARAKVVARPQRPAPVSSLRQGRGLSFALASAVMLALLVGLVAGDLLGRSTAPSTSSQVARFSLSGHGSLAGASAMVIELKNDGVVLVDFNGLPPLEAGKVYEVWLITPSGRPDAVAVFVPDSNGSKVVLVNKSLAGYAQMAITAEKAPDGSAAPTQQPQLYGSLA